MTVTKINRETFFKGLPLSGGVAVAKVCLFNEKRHNNIPVYRAKTKSVVENELKRFKLAVKVAAKRLDDLIREVKQKLGKAEAEIFTAQKMILHDVMIQKRIVDEIRKNQLNAETAVTSALDYYESRILEMDNEYIKERASDIGEIKRRILDVLIKMNPAFQCEGEKFCRRGRSRIVVAEELTPTLTMELDTDSIQGFVTERGGVASHGAILARALRVPAVSGIPNIQNRVFCGSDVLINGDQGEIVIWPSEKTIAKFPQLKSKTKVPIQAVEPIEGLKVMANLSRAEDVGKALDFKAEGVGLYRTEFEFLAAGKLLTESEQFNRYRAVLKAMKGHVVYFRLLDVGGDKTASFFKLPKEENPNLGFRGSRFLLGRPGLFKTQARALARASKFAPVHVMYPMIIDLDQFLKLKNLFRESTKDIVPQDIKHGIMFEVPSACFQAPELLEAADFASIGSNDLIQYLFSVDRNNELVAYDYHPDREVFWSLIRGIAQAAKGKGRPLSVCGEIAGDPKYIDKLVEAGIDTVSVSPKLISGLRLAIKNNRKQTALA